ncbi:MAG: hypothetical protein WCL23_02810 [Candidatus Moraniibacteriota bacterium]
MKDEREIQKEIDWIFEEARLSEDDRGLWRGRLAKAGEKFRLAFIESFGGENDLLRFLTGDLRKRIDAGRDRRKLELILAEERVYFTGLLRHVEEQ